MVALSYELSYANVPLLIDEAVLVRIPPAPREAPFTPEEKEAPRKHQPLPDLIDELDRLLPFEYLQNFSLASPFPGRNLSALALPSSLGQDVRAHQLRINDYYYPSSASRWSVFRGLATSSMVKAMVAVAFPAGTDPTTTKGTPQTFTMKASPISPSNPGNVEASYTISTSLYMLPPRPLAEHGADFDGLFLINLVDERYYFPGTPATVHVSASTTWAGLVAQLATALGITIAAPTVAAVYSTPEPDSQLWTNAESAAALLDAVAANIGTVVVRALDGTYSLKTYSESATVVATARGNAASVVRTAGGDLFSDGTTKLKAGDLRPARNTIVPATITVTFPKYVQGDDPVPHFVNPRYQPQRPSTWYEDSFGDVHAVSVGISGTSPFASSLTGVSSLTIRCTAKALFSGENQAVSGGTPLNASGLTALATQLAKDRWDAQAAVALDESYPGTLVWVPEGVHDLIWTHSARHRLACLRVMKTEWNNSINDVQHAAHALSGYTNVPRGVGGQSVALTVRDTLAAGATGVLSGNVASGDYFLLLSGASSFPTASRWRGIIGSGQADEEIALFEGLSGGTSGGIVFRGIDGSIQQPHSGATILQVAPNTAYGVNLLTFGRGLTAVPGAWASGGVSEAVAGIASGGVGSGMIASGGININNFIITSGMLGSGVIQSGAIASGALLAFLFGASSGYVLVSGYGFPVAGSGVFTMVSGYPTPLPSGPACVMVSGFQAPLPSGVYNTVSGHPYPVISGVWITVSGYPYPILSGVYTLVSGYPIVSGTYFWYAVFGGGPKDVHYWRHPDSSLLSGRRYTAAIDQALPGTASVLANDLWAIPFVTPRAATVDRIGAALTLVGAAGTKLRLGIYRATSDSNLYPNALLVDSGELAADVVQTVEASITAVLDSRFLHYLAIWTNAASLTLVGIQIGACPPILGYDTGYTNPATSMLIAGTYGALPATFLSGAIVQSVPVPSIGVRYQN